MSVPIIFIQLGSRDYFNLVYHQACKNDNTVIVIGNDSTTPLKHADIKDYSESANTFSKVYQHLSTNSYEAELICFNRWFILYEYMIKNGIDRCLHLDTDVMLYANAEKEIKKFEQYDFTLSHRCCGSNSFFTLKGLAGFCTYVLQMYSNKSSIEFDQITAHYTIRQKHGLPGGVSDMLLLDKYSSRICGMVGEMMHIVNDSTYDHNINVSDQHFKMSGQSIKEVSFFENLPYCHQTTTGKEIRFNTLHFQGPAKRFMNSYLQKE
jgi:hypothetical protein